MHSRQSGRRDAGAEICAAQRRVSCCNGSARCSAETVHIRICRCRRVESTEVLGLLAGAGVQITKNGALEDGATD